MEADFARSWLRLEGLLAAGIAALLYWRWELPWGWFAAFFLAPDLAMLGYLAGPRIGAWSYNLAHSYTVAGLPLAAGLIGFGGPTQQPALFVAGLVWCAHIGFDRALGYGLKSSAGFGVTHLGRLGRAPRTE